MTNCLQTLFYDVQCYFACITAKMEAFWEKIYRRIRRCLLITYMLFCHSGWSIGRDFSTDCDHWPLCNTIPAAQLTLISWKSSWDVSRMQLLRMLWLMSCCSQRSISITRLHPALSRATVSIFLQLNLKPTISISLSRSLFQVSLGRPFPLWLRDVHCSTCLAMLSSLRLSVCLIQCHFFFEVVLRLAVHSFSSTVLRWLFCLASVWQCICFFKSEQWTVRLFSN